MVLGVVTMAIQAPALCPSFSNGFFVTLTPAFAKHTTQRRSRRPGSGGVATKVYIVLGQSRTRAGCPDFWGCWVGHFEVLGSVLQAMSDPLGVCWGSSFA